MRYLYLYQDQASVLVSTMKYRPSLALCRTAAALLSEKLDLLFENRDWDAIVPVPPSRASLRLRGFAPCDVMATLLAANSKPKQRLYLSALRHCGSNTPQAALPPAKRRLNVARAFAADPKYVQGRRILLLDDVLTTGATSQACALALQQAGVFSVDLLNLCRAPNWNRYRLGALQRGNHE
jgi:ComF family protein